MSLSPTAVNTSGPSTSHSAHPSRPPMRNKSSSALSTHSSRTGTSSHSHTTHAVHRPKRNKSSSSLHSAGHHTVQFPHHGRKNSTSSSGSHKRSGSHSGGRKPAFGFGMTSLTSAEDHHHGSDDEDDHDDDEQERTGRRPGFDRRGSSASTIVSGEQSRGRQRSSDGRGSRSRSRARSSPERRQPEKVEVNIQDVTPMATPPREEMRRPNQEENPQHLKKGGAIDKVVGSYQSTAGTGSDWESATDSPAPAKKKELPEAPRAYRQDTISGLGKVLGEGDRIASEEDARLGNETSTSDLVGLKTNGNGLKEEEKSRPATPRRAKFEIDDSDDTSPPSPEALQQLQQLDQQPVDAPAPAIAPGPRAAETPFASEPQSPVKEHELKPVTPPQDRTKSAPSIADAAAQVQTSTVPFPSSTTLNDTPRSQSTAAAAAPPSPSHPNPHSRPNTGRKSSNASLMSNASVRSNALSFAGRMGPPAPHLFRRTASSAAPPTLDRSSIAKAEMANLEAEGTERESREGGSGTRKVSGGHRRTESLGSVRSLRTVAEGGHVGPTSPSGHPKRAATLGVHDGRDATRRLRQSTGSESSGALAALGNIQGGADRGGPPRRSASGYFSSALRGLTTQFPGLTPPISPSASVGAGLSAAAGGGGAGGRYPIPGATTPQHGAGAGRGKQRASPSPAQFAPLVISKFIEPQDLLAPQQQEQQQQQQQQLQQQLSASPSSSRFGPGARNASSASLSGGGAMSRTQQKALLARDAPYWSGSNTPNSSAPNGAQPTPSGSGYYNPNQPSTALHAPLPLPPPPATQLLPLTTNASQPQQYHQQPSQSAKMARTASGGTNSYPASAASPAPGDQARQQGMQKWAYGLVREAERIERQYRAVEKWRDPLGESLERVLKARKERLGAGKASANGVATAQSGAAVVAAKAVGAV
ncbi:hypothetical protein BCR35DRAFT_331163 [Leucosporidium creatinivorum]|uniref:Uncharacterized protein n=1 Tax=Leucosporidium creatinivorum TaxID=106004 RepID=A0A1Y2FHU0_9BASI|nr:hypothetical protein BCR35DRAFT_331163 [Leucosporidium creatinivorum]